MYLFLVFHFVTAVDWSYLSELQPSTYNHIITYRIILFLFVIDSHLLTHDKAVVSEYLLCYIHLQYVYIAYIYFIGHECLGIYNTDGKIAKELIYEEHMKYKHAQCGKYSQFRHNSKIRSHCLWHHILHLETAGTAASSQQSRRWTIAGSVLLPVVSDECVKPCVSMMLHMRHTSFWR